MLRQGIPVAKDSLGEEELPGAKLISTSALTCELSCIERLLEIKKNYATQTQTVRP